MPIFMVERRFADELEAARRRLTGSIVLTTRKAYAGSTPFSQPTSAKLIACTRRLHRRRSGGRPLGAELPADVIVEVTDRVLPGGTSVPIGGS